MTFRQHTIKTKRGTIRVPCFRCRGCGVRLTCPDFRGKRYGRRAMPEKRQATSPPAMQIVDRLPDAAVVSFLGVVLE